MWFLSQRCVYARFWREFKSEFETKNWPALWEALSKWWLEFNYKEALGLHACQFLVSNPDFLAPEPHTLSPLFKN